MPGSTGRMIGECCKVVLSAGAHPGGGGGVDSYRLGASGYEATL